MLETGLVLAAIVAAGLAAVLAPALRARLVTAFGIGTLLAGLLLGLSTGLWYHVVLYRLVSARLALPPTWWLFPATLHRHLTDGERRRIRPWYRLGGLGFVLCVVG